MCNNIITNDKSHHSYTVVVTNIIILSILILTYSDIFYSFNKIINILPHFILSRRKYLFYDYDYFLRNINKVLLDRGMTYVYVYTVDGMLV